MKSIAEFKGELAAAAQQFFPDAPTRLLRESLIFLKFRIECKAEASVDVYYNALNGRTDYALVVHNHRVFGVDNLQEWHRHPFGAADGHVFCAPPDLAEVFREMKEIIESNFP